jgi:hypothetical protein
LIWQDMVIGIGSILFTLVLLPELLDVWHGKTMNVWSASFTSIILGIYCIAYASLGLWFAAIPHTTAIWGCIAYFSWKNKAKE